MSNPSGHVRPAVASDIPIIRKWLVQYSAFDTLADNWHITLHVFQTKGMLVFEDEITREPIAYFWGNLAGVDSVLEVRYDRRGEGIGRHFVNFLISQAREAGKRVLSVQCAPHTSCGFWRRMGFEVEREDHHWVGRKTL